MTKKVLLLLAAACLMLAALAIPAMADDADYQLYTVVTNVVPISDGGTEVDDDHSNLLVAIYPQTNVICMNERYLFRFCKICSVFVDVNTEKPLGHKFGEWKVTKEPSCENDGERTRACSGYQCTVVEKEKIDKLGGKCDWFDQVAVTPPTCTEDAYRHSYCKVCGTTRKLTVTPAQPALGHDTTGATISKVAATDKTTGYQEFTCARCKVKVKQYEHTADKCGAENPGAGTTNSIWKWNDKGSTEPTCTADGVEKKECNVCSRLKENVLPKGHTWVKNDKISHKCTKCPVVEQHKWEKVNATEHKCALCNVENEKHECKSQDNDTAKCKCTADKIAHIWKNVPAESKHKCDNCLVLADHDWKRVPDTDTHKCSKCEVAAVACTYDAGADKCKVCDGQKPPTQHVHNWASIGTGSHKCTTCQALEEHVWEEKDGKHKCKCGAEHVIPTVWDKKDDAKHKCPTCNIEANHEWENNTATENKKHKCKKCSAEEPHEFRDLQNVAAEHICDKCNYKTNHKVVPDGIAFHKCEFCPARGPCVFGELDACPACGQAKPTTLPPE